VTIVYNVGIVIELFSGIEGPFLAIDLVFLAISIFIITGVIYANYSNKIMINYWLCIVLQIRICLGLNQEIFPAIGYHISKEASIIWGFNTYTKVESLLYLLINVSHKNKIIAPIIIHFIAKIS
jgi:hypothetical protein